MEVHAPATATPTAGTDSATGAIFTGRRMISRTTAMHAAFPQCTSYSVRPLYPTIQGRTETFMPHSCTPPLLVTIKGGGGLPLSPLDSGWTFSGFSFPRGRSGTTEHSSEPTPLLAETWRLPSISHLVCIPCYKHSGCKIIQCPRTSPLLDVRPRGRNQDKPRVTVLPLASSSGMRKHAAFTSWDPVPLGQCLASKRETII